MKRVAAFILGILSVVSAGVWAVSGGGFPSQPTFQKVTVGSSTGIATLAFANAGAAKDFLCMTITSGCTTGEAANDVTLRTNSTTIHFTTNNGTSDAMSISGAGVVSIPGFQTSGTFTSTLSTGCTTTPTATVSWVKTGSIVTVWWPANSWSCTSNTSTKTTDASIPAAERPTTTKCLGIVSGENNTSAAIMTAQVTSSGTFNFGIANSGTGASDCNGVNATTSGTFAIDSGSFTYTLQ